MSVVHISIAEQNVHLRKIRKQIEKRQGAGREVAWAERGLAAWSFISPVELLCPPTSSLSIHVHIPVLVGVLQLLTLEELDRTGGGWAAAESMLITIRAGTYRPSATGMRLTAGEGLKRSHSRPNRDSEKRNMDAWTS